MRWKYYTIRFIELITIFTSCYLAVNSFFHSFIYQQAKLLVAQALAKYNISYSIVSIDPDFILPLFITVLVFFTAFYYWLFGSRENIISIYHFNMILFIPEALSFSKLDWMMLFDIPQTFFITERAFTQNLIAALVIMSGYITLFMTNRFLETMEANSIRGALQSETDSVFVNQSVISYVVLALTFLMIVGATIIVPVIQVELHTLLQTQKYRYVLLGLVSTCIVSASLLIYYREKITSHTTLTEENTN